MQIFILFGLLFSSLVQAHEIKLMTVEGLKFPNSIEEGVRPMASTALVPSDIRELGGFNHLLPFVTPSPDQEDANSCMLMSLTGTVEWWMHRLNNQTEFIQDGDLDLSERWWMNLSSYEDHLQKVNYWFSDAIEIFNTSASALNRDYRFAKGWYVESEDDIVRAQPHSRGATYGVRVNWIDETDEVTAPLVKLPQLRRKVLLRNKKENPWAIGVAPKNIVEKVMDAFEKYQAPIQVIYNHEGYWHSVYIVGYDKDMSSHNCPFIRESLESYQSEADTSEKEGDFKRAAKFLRYKRELLLALSKNGGCQPKGMFYVRDSQYPDASEEDYVYDPANPSANKPYSKRIVLREFDWIRTMANHINVIYVNPLKTSELPE